MLTNLDFLKTGSPWPPISERDRLKKYEENKKLFKGEHNKVYADWVRLLREDKKATLEIILNWHKRISVLWADLLIGEPPKITVGKDSSAEQVEIDNIVENNELLNTVYQIVIDISRFGTGIFNIYNDGSNGIIDITPPSIWYPVVSPDNIKKISYHVLAWTVSVKQGNSTTAYLKVQIHEKGKYTLRQYMLRDGTILKEIEEPKSIQTGLSDFAIIPIHNIVTSDTVFGADDYSDLDSILQEMEIRIAQISRILDKHSDPNMYGDEATLDENPETGEVTFLGGGKFFPVSENGEKPGYLVWDAQLDANWKELEFLLSQLYILSETSAAAFGELKAGMAESGSALKRLMLAPLAKTQRIRLRVDPALKKAIKLCSQIGNGKNLSKESINISWQDGLPRDDREEAEIMAIRTGANGGARTISVHTAIKRLDNKLDTEVIEEMDRIKEDEMSADTFLTPPLSGDNRTSVTDDFKAGD